MKKLTLFLSIMFLTILTNNAYAFGSSRMSVSINPPSIQANMGDKITYTGTITNNSDKTVTNVITYISLASVSQGKESPVDLEDWSANKAFKVDEIRPHATFQGKWPIRLIDSGSYVTYITVVDKNDDVPISSTMSHLEIKRVLRLNPNNVLPVAVGEPLVIGIVFALIAFKRKHRIK